MTDVFIIGCKGIPAQYGGFETFVEQLTARKKSNRIMYHVSCMARDEKHFEYNGADCFNVRVAIPGPAGRILHVSRALAQVEKWVKRNRPDGAVVYILGCRIGPLMAKHYRRLHKLGVRVCVNPDGLEWKRDKWSGWQKRFLRYCEGCLVRNADLAICDSRNIENYVKETYGTTVKETTFAAYGADVENLACPDACVDEWYRTFDLQPFGYYLIVGRFVPENNYETMIREFMRSETNKQLVIITNVEHNKFYDALKKSTKFDCDPRIRFVGTVYDAPLLQRIRKQAYAYLHGHEVGGTNPSLLEALGLTRLNLLLGVGFNREVAEDAALYWDKRDGSLSGLIARAEILTEAEIEEYGERAKKRIVDEYSWDAIVHEYERIFLLGEV